MAKIESTQELLERILYEYNSEFSFNEEENTFCLFGEDEQGNYWETDDFTAASYEEAAVGAINYLLEYNRVDNEDIVIKYSVINNEHVEILVSGDNKIINAVDIFFQLQAIVGENLMFEYIEPVLEIGEKGAFLSIGGNTMEVEGVLKNRAQKVERVNASIYEKEPLDFKEFFGSLLCESDNKYPTPIERILGSPELYENFVNELLDWSSDDLTEALNDIYASNEKWRNIAKSSIMALEEEAFFMSLVKKIRRLSLDKFGQSLLRGNIGKLYYVDIAHSKTMCRNTLW